MTPLHVYCLTGAGTVEGLAEGVRQLSYGQVGMVVGPGPVRDYRALPKDALIRLLAAHQAVIERVMHACETVVPVRFGTAVAGEDEAAEILRRGRVTIRGLLARMAGRLQIELLVLWNDLDRVLREIGEDDKIRRLKAEVESVAAKVKVGEQVKALLDERRASCAEAILAAVSDLADDSRVHARLDDTVVVNAAFLLEREKRDAFERRIDEVDRRFDDRLRFRIVAPLPPYSFSTVAIARPDLAAIERARKTLALAESATLAEIKEAKRRLTRECHPDHAGANGESVERFEEISAAYRLLSDHCRNTRCSLREADLRRDIRIQRVDIQDDAA